MKDSDWPNLAHVAWKVGTTLRKLLERKYNIAAVLHNMAIPLGSLQNALMIQPPVKRAHDILVQVVLK